MFGNLVIRGNYVIWHRAHRGVRETRWSERFDRFLSRHFITTEGSFGRDICFSIPLRVRIRIYAFICLLLSLKLYVVRELVAGFLMVSAFSAAVFIPLSIGFVAYKAGQKFYRKEGVRSVDMNNIIRFPGKDRQLDELLARLAANQRGQVVLSFDPQKATTRNGLLLINALPRRAS